MNEWYINCVHTVPELTQAWYKYTVSQLLTALPNFNHRHRWYIRLAAC